MEVFPPDDPQSNEVGNRPTVSEIDQMRAWDDSFANLEKVLQAACEKSDPQKELSNCDRKQDVSSAAGSPSENSINKTEIKRKWIDETIGSHSDESNKQKIKRMNSMILGSGEVTIQLVNSPGNSCDTSPISDLLSSIKSDKKPKYDFSSDLPANKTSNDGKNSVEFIKLESKGEIKIEKSDVKIEKACNVFSNLDNIAIKEENFSNDLKIIVSSEIKNECEFNEDLTTDMKNKFCSQSDDPLFNKLKDSDLKPVVEMKTEIKTDLSMKSEVSENAFNKVSSEAVAPFREKDEYPPCTKLESSDSYIDEKREERDKDELSDRNSKKEDKLSKKKKFERCNIRDIKLEEELDAVTLSAQKEEQERIRRLQEAQMRALQERLQQIEVEKEALSQLFSQSTGDETSLFDNNSLAEAEVPADEKKITLKPETDEVLIESSDEDKKSKLQNVISTSVTAPLEENVIDISSSSSGNESDSDDSDKKDDDIMVLSDEGEPAETAEDPNNSGAHTNDCFNLPDEEGRVLVNVGHPPEDPDIFLAPQIAKVIKPHQIGGIRFLYDNVVENLERYKSSSGFGCILAHSMGLGKTVQVVSFIDVFLRHTPAKLVLCIVPINTIQNWKAEFDMWVPSANCVDDTLVITGEIRPRDYNIYTLNENFKTMAARASLIAEWRKNGGVLLMGYEMYRMLALRKMPKIPIKKSKRLKKQELNIEPETNEQIKKYMDEMYEHIVIPGPDLVICDEGHRIKNSLASTSMALKSIKTRRRVVLTGYPLQNNLLEYWCMVDFVRPNYLGSRAEFCNMFERPISNGQCIDSTPRDRQLMRFRSHVLHSLLVGFVQRRGHSVLRAVLPKKEEHVLLIRMTPIQRQLYKCFVKDLLYVQQATNPLKLFAVCCKIWNHPDILYKLLQEKKAQEDIDLDIDITMAANSGVSGRNCGVRKKGYQTKSKMQGSIKALPRKSEANFSSTESLKSDLDVGTIKGNEIKLDNHKEECDISVQASNVNLNEFSQISQPFHSTYNMKNTINPPFGQTSYDTPSDIQYSPKNQGNIPYSSKSKQSSHQHFTLQSSQPTQQHMYPQPSVTDTPYGQPTQNQFSVRNNQHFNKADSQIQSSFGMHAAGLKQDSSTNISKSSSQSSYQAKVGHSFQSQNNSCLPYVPQTEFLNQIQNSNQEFSNQSNSTSDSYSQSSQPLSSNLQQSFSNTQTSHKFSTQSSDSQVSNQSSHFSQQNCGNPAPLYSQMSNQKSSVSDQTSFSPQSSFLHSKCIPNNSQQTSLSQPQYSLPTQCSQLPHQYSQQSTSKQQSQYPQVSSTQVFSQQSQAPEYSQTNQHQTFQQNLQNFNEQQTTQSQLRSSHKSYAENSESYSQPAPAVQQFSPFSQQYMQSDQQYSQQPSQDSSSSNFESMHSFPRQAAQNAYASKHGQPNTFSQTPQGTDTIPHTSNSAKSVSEKQSCNSPSEKGAIPTKYNQQNYSDEHPAESEYSLSGKSPGFSQQLSQSNSHSFTEQINLASQYADQHTSSLQISTQISNPAHYGTQTTKQGDAYTHQESHFSPQENQPTEQYSNSTAKYNQAQGPQYSLPQLQNAEQFCSAPQLDSNASNSQFPQQTQSTTFQQASDSSQQHGQNIGHYNQQETFSQQSSQIAQQFSHGSQNNLYSQQTSKQFLEQTQAPKQYSQSSGQGSQLYAQQPSVPTSQFSQSITQTSEFGKSCSSQQCDQTMQSSQYTQKTVPSQMFDESVGPPQMYSQTAQPSEYDTSAIQPSQQYNSNNAQPSQQYNPNNGQPSQQFNPTSAQPSQQYNPTGTHSSQQYNPTGTHSSQQYNPSSAQSSQQYNPVNAQSSQQYNPTNVQPSHFNQAPEQSPQQLIPSETQASSQVNQAGIHSPQQFSHNIPQSAQSFEKSGNQISQTYTSSHSTDPYQSSGQPSQKFNQASQMYNQPSQGYQQNVQSSQYNLSSHTSQHFNQSNQTQFSPKAQCSQQYSQQSYSQTSQSPQQFIQHSLQPSQQFNQPTQSSQQQFNQPTQSSQQQFNQPTQSSQQQFNQPTQSSQQQFNQPTQSSQQQFNQPTQSSQQQFNQSTQSSQQQYNQLPSQFNQSSTHSSQQYQHPPPSPQHFVQQASKSPQQFSQPTQSPQQFSQPVASPQQFSQPATSPQQFSQPTPSPQQFSQPAPSPQQFSQPAPSPQQFSQPVPSPQQFSQTAPSPQQFSQPVPSPQQFSQTVPSPQQYSQTASSTQQFSQTVPSTQQFSQPAPSSQQFCQGAPSSQQFCQPAPSPQQFSQTTSPQQFSQPASSSQQFSQPAPSSQQFTQPNQSPQQYSHPIPSPQQFSQPSPSQQFPQSAPSPQSFSQHQSSQQFSPLPLQFNQQPTQQNSQVLYSQQTSTQHFSPQSSQSSTNQQYSHISSQAQYKQQPVLTGQSSQYSVSPDTHQQFSNPFSQTPSQSSKKSPFQSDYQAQSVPASPQQNLSSQLCGQQTGKQNSRSKTKSPRVKSLGQASVAQTSVQPNLKPPPSFSVQAFQNSSQSSLQPTVGQHLGDKSQDSRNALFQPLNSSTTKQENFTLQHVTTDSSSSCPAKCPKAVLQPVKNSTQEITQSSQPTSDVIQLENDQKNSNSAESAIVPFRDRLDSSINYEWAVPIMKDYVLGVLENSHKMMVLFVIIAETLQMGDKLLVFSQSLSTLDLLEQFLSRIQVPRRPDQSEPIAPETWARNKNYFRLDGSTSAQEREKLINEFNRNDSVSLFLLSTRAGCLGINLVGANRIVVMDASWNPCHDAQAVCRIYRYGQKKQCYIYRLVTDNSLEKRIYDRQVNKQGMSDRVVDELNPESNFTWKDVTTLIQDDEDDGPVQELSKFAASYSDSVLKYLVSEMSPSLSKEPFEHESLLLDRKDLKLTKQEKRLAKQSYEMAKRANMINIRTTYTYLPSGTAGGGQFIINNKQCQWVGGTTIRVLPNQTNSALGNTRSGSTATPITASPSLMSSLFKQGVMVQKLTMPSNVSIPVLTPGAPPVVIPAGQDVLVLRTPKGVYLRLPDGRIIAVQLPPSLLAKTQFRPNVVTHFRPAAPKGGNQSNTVINTPRGQSIGIIKQTLQCGGTVRYLGPRNAAGSSGHNINRNAAPEVIDLSDDDEPSVRKQGIGSNTSTNSSESESGSGDAEKTEKLSSIFPGKHITIRKITSSSPSSSTSKEKCEIPQMLSKNKQITILPINPSSHQNRQKFAPQLAQPVRVQQMLLQPQQGKRKLIQKNAAKIQMSPLLSGKSSRPQISVTQPSMHLGMQHEKVCQSLQNSKSLETTEKNDQSNGNGKLQIDSSAMKISDRSLKQTATVHQQNQNLQSKNLPPSESGKIRGSILPPSLAALAVNPSLQITPSSCTDLSASDSLSQKSNYQTKSLVQSTPGIMCAQNENVQNSHSLKSGLQITPSPSMNPNMSSDSIVSKSAHRSKSPVQNLYTSPILSIEQSNPGINPGKCTYQTTTMCSVDNSSKKTSIHSKSPIQSPSVQAEQSENFIQSVNPNLLITPLPRSEPSVSDLYLQQKSTVQTSSTMSVAESDQNMLCANASIKGSLTQNSPDNTLLQVQTTCPVLSNKTAVSQQSTNIPEPSILPKSQLSSQQHQNSFQTSSLQQLFSQHSNNETKSKQNQHPTISYSSQTQSLPNSLVSFPSPATSLSSSQTQPVSSRKRKSSNKQSSKKTQQHLLLPPNHTLPKSLESPQPFLHPPLSDHLMPENHFPTFPHHISGSDFTAFSNFSSHKAAGHIQHPQPLHPLQHSQEHSLLPHLQHMSHLYAMSPHLTGTSTLTDVQPPAPRAWSVPQPPVSSFLPFGQSSPFFNSGQDGQFSFPSSFPLPPSSLTSLSQSDLNVNIVPESEKSSRIGTSDL